MLLPLRNLWMVLALALCSVFLPYSIGTPEEDFPVASPLCQQFQGLKACRESAGVIPEKRKSAYMRFGKRKSAYMRWAIHLNMNHHPILLKIWQTSDWRRATGHCTRGRLASSLDWGGTNAGYGEAKICVHALWQEEKRLYEVILHP